MAGVKTSMLLLLAGSLQTLTGTINVQYDEDNGNYSIYLNESAEDYFSYEDYYDATSSYDYTNSSTLDDSLFEIAREKEKTSGSTASVLLPTHWMIFFTILPLFLYFPQEDFCMDYGK